MPLRKTIRRQLSNFAWSVARLVSDSRRQGFIEEMITGLVIGRHVHLTKIAWAAGRWQFFPLVMEPSAAAEHLGSLPIQRSMCFS